MAAGHTASRSDRQGAKTSALQRHSKLEVSGADMPRSGSEPRASAPGVMACERRENKEKEIHHSNNQGFFKIAWVPTRRNTTVSPSISNVNR